MFVKRILICLCAVVLTWQAAHAKSSALVVDSASGYVLYATDADTQHFPASLTKLMTLYLTFDAMEKGLLKEDELLPVSMHAADQPKSKLGLKKNDLISVHDAIVALIIKSANDVAVTLAEALAPSEEDFADMMTSVAYDLGMHDTVFKNASGLHHPQQVTSAKDMAILSIAIINHFPQYYPLFNTRSFTYNGRTYETGNNILRHYKGAEGMKTGFVSAVGYNMISTATQEDRRLVGIVLSGNTPQERDLQMKQILDKGFAIIRKVKDHPKSQLAAILAKKAYIPKKPDNFVAQVSDSITQMRQKVAVLNPENSRFAMIQRAPPVPPAFKQNRDLIIEQGDLAVSDWGIQVGSFASYAQAERQALTAQTLLNMPQAKVLIEPHDSFFRARLNGFETRNDAQQGCLRLKGAQIPCLVLKTYHD